MSRRSGRLPKFLVLAPTRELAKQVEKEIKESAPYLSTVCVYGGVSYTIQQSALSRGVDVVVGTPGRIIDLIEGRSLKLGEVEYLVLDEADQMLAVGFEEAVESILENLPQKRQSMLFSATMPTWVKKLARKYLDNPLNIDLVKAFLCSFSLFWFSCRCLRLSSCLFCRLVTKMRSLRRGSSFMQSQRHQHQSALF